MSDAYSKKPTVKRFTRKPTYPGRDVKRTVITRRNRPVREERRRLYA